MHKGIWTGNGGTANIKLKGRRLNQIGALHRLIFRKARISEKAYLIVI